MHLNTLKPKAGSRPNGKRVGRGIGSGRGKTCGSGHKGQKSRSGGSVRRGFEGGQMPLYRRLPKSGFSHDNKIAEVRLGELQSIDSASITLQDLQAAGVVAKEAKGVKVFLSGEITKAVNLEGILVTKGARLAIEAAGGTITEAATAA